MLVADTGVVDTHVAILRTANLDRKLLPHLDDFDILPRGHTNHFHQNVRLRFWQLNLVEFEFLVVDEDPVRVDSGTDLARIDSEHEVVVKEPIEDNRFALEPLSQAIDVHVSA